ncbi:MAG: type II toxin-antitoxin system HicB family antitoxin [Chloroflexota bacterium]|nr:type II toxin-antitoxin system HicB family antitoxin [Chloroflexota bacterium]
MLTKYIEAAMRHAEYEIIEDDNSFYGHIRELEGLWANAATLEACRDELRSALEDWLLLGFAWKDEIPVVDGIDINVHVKAPA